MIIFKNNFNMWFGSRMPQEKKKECVAQKPLLRKVQKRSVQLIKK
uniref:Uncharacterized protein n=1 Tax=Meloidogyne enterolobii TaxID=390850 RepID=A0A6V7Y7P1_MELEN|nr:unnamed protein product [Meloidogyne enterolobii]